MNRTVQSWLSVMAILCAFSAKVEAEQYTIRILDAPEGHYYSGASGINNLGQIAGYSAPTAAGNNSPRAVLWNSTGAHELGFTLTSDRLAEINDRGQVVGGNSVWRDGDVSALPTLLPAPYGGNHFTDITHQGWVIGQSQAVIIGGYGHATYWDEAGIHDLGTLPEHQSSVAYGANDRGQIVGTSGYGSYPSYSVRGFVWDDGIITDVGALPGYNETRAFDVNNLGQVVGGTFNKAYEYSGVYERAFIWQDGVMTDLLGLSDRSSRAIKITDSGLVLGYTYTYRKDYNPFVWENGTVTWLQGLGRVSYNVRDINEAGWVVGQAQGTDRYDRAVLWEPVIPEPHSLFVLSFPVAGLGGTVVRRRRR